MNSPVCAETKYSPYVGIHWEKIVPYDPETQSYTFLEEQHTYWEGVSYLVKSGVKLFGPENAVGYSIQSNNMSALGAVRMKLFGHVEAGYVVVTSGLRPISPNNFNHPFGAMDFRNKHLSMFERFLEGAVLSKTLSSTGRNRRVLVEGPIRGDKILISQFIDGKLITSKWKSKGRNQNECIHVDTNREVQFAEEQIISPYMVSVSPLSVEEMKLIIDSLTRHELIEAEKSYLNYNIEPLTWSVYNKIVAWENWFSFQTGRPFSAPPSPYNDVFVSNRVAELSSLPATSDMLGLRNSASADAPSSSLAGASGDGDRNPSPASGGDSVIEMNEYRDSLNDGPPDTEADVSLGPTERIND